MIKEIKLNINMQRKIEINSVNVNINLLNYFVNIKRFSYI
jgi:hypothetical protein